MIDGTSYSRHGVSHLEWREKNEEEGDREAEERDTGSMREESIKR
jgi:hypothetical protein